MSVVRVTLSAEPLLVQTFCFFRVLALRRIASPTETELRLERSHMVNEALEMIDVQWHSEETSMVSVPTDAQAEP